MKINRYNQFISEKKKIEYQKRLDESFINEEVGLKDVLIGLATLAGVLGGKMDVEAAKNKLSDKQVVKNIEMVLNDKDQLDKAIDSLESRGMEDAAEIIQNNAEKAKEQIKKFGATKQIGAKDYYRLAELLKKGYAISGITTKTAIDTIMTKPEYENSIVYFDTLDIDYNSDELFGVGLYELSPEFKDSLNGVLDQLKENELSVLAFNIESSTDKQRIGGAGKRLEADGYEASNKGLSEARNNSVKESIESIFSDSEMPIINQEIKYDQGKGEDNAATPQDPSARYVTIQIVCKKIQPNLVIPPASKPTEVEYLIQSFLLVKGDSVEVEKENGKTRTYKTKTRGVKRTACPKFFGKRR
jgi:outer membrane protein OmpA-like peptidoglycan-associated protein